MGRIDPDQGREVPNPGVSRQGRERWASRAGLILAAAGNAVGLGNFLRFPVQAVSNGGGAFMIPYFCALVFLGIPLMWIEWVIGRHGGRRGHSTTPGMFEALWDHPVSKYLGALGLFLSLTVMIYYVYVESWALAYSLFSVLGAYTRISNLAEMSQFLRSYQGLSTDGPFATPGTAYLFLLLTLLTNFAILYRGISRGIEVLAKVAMPLLFVFAVVLVVRVFTLGTPDPAFPDRSVWSGFAFLWNPRFEELGHASVWLAAAGQIFFTLSVGMGTLQTYASYLRENDDIVLSGLSTSTLNEFVEVVLGASIAIPVAVAFFGLQTTREIAHSGTFNLGFVSMPVVFTRMPYGELLGMLWFGLLFIAGVTSSVAMGQPLVAFLQEEFGLNRRRAVVILAAVVTSAVQLVVLFYGYGFDDEMDFWAGTLGLAVFALIETLLLFWVFGADRAWQELHRGAAISIPRVFKWIMKYVTPGYLIGLLFIWTIDDALPKLRLQGVPLEAVPYRWQSRGLMLVLLVGILLAVKMAWQRRNREE